MKIKIILSALAIFIFGLFSSTLSLEGKKNSFSIEVKKISPSKKAVLKLKEKVFVWLSYKVPENYDDGVYIWLIPNIKKSTRGTLSLGGAIIYQPSPLIKNKQGSISRYFAIKKGNTIIRKIYVRMMDKKRNKILAQKAIRVSFKIIGPSEFNKMRGKGFPHRW